MMIKVLYITDSMKQRFGVTSVIMNYLSHFDYSKIQIDLLAFSDSEDIVVEKAKECGAQVFFMPRLNMKNLHEFISFLDSFFASHKYDIVHSHFNQIDRIVFPIAKKNNTKVCISHSHSTKLSTNRMKAIRNRLMCINLYSIADVCAACSESAGIALFGNRFIHSEKKLLIHNAIESEKFAFNMKYRELIRKDLGLEDSTIAIGHVGSLKPEKNQAFLLRVFSKVIKNSKGNKYKLIIVGDGELKQELTQLADDLNISDYVIFTGLRKDTNIILQGFDIFVLPSLFEGLPVSGVEAQTAGLPCIFSSSITREVGIIDVQYIDLDEDEWAIQIQSIAEKNLIRKNNKEIIAQHGYDIRYEAEKLTNTYYELIAKD